MKNFIRICLVLSLLMFSAGFLLRSVHSAYAGDAGNHKRVDLMSATDPTHVTKVLWVNIDSIDANYKAYKALSDSASTEYNYKMKLYQDKAQDLQKRYDALQQKVKLGSISADDAQSEEFLINSGMNDLKIMETELDELQKSAMADNAKITKEVTDYLKMFSISRKADYIVGYGGGNSDVLYANPELDVTNTVLKALNAQYDAAH